MVSNLMFYAQSTSKLIIIRARVQNGCVAFANYASQRHTSTISGKSAFPFLLTGASNSFGPIARINMY